MSKQSCELVSCSSEERLLGLRQPVHELRSPRKRSFQYCTSIIWYLSSLMLGLILGVGISQIDLGRKCIQEGFWRPREFGSAKNEMDAIWKDRIYDAKLVYNSTGDMIRPASNPEYVGTPTPEMDKAWQHILPAVTVWITPEEEKQYKDGGLVYFPKYDLYKGQLSVTHELHCVNLLRQYISLDYYPELAADSTLSIHIEHCLDRLRLAIMCAGDMTVEPIKYAEDGRTMLPVWPTMHSCRDFSAIREWALMRDAAHPQRLHRNAARLKATGM